MQTFLAALGATADKPSPYAANAYDCVNLIALAALSAGSTLPIDRQVHTGSQCRRTPCMTFVDCRDDLTNGSNINYDGPDGCDTRQKGEVVIPGSSCSVSKTAATPKVVTIP